MIGSRNIGQADEDFTSRIAKQAAFEGLNIVSGGARGVDETAMLASLNSEGTALGVLASDLLKAALSAKWRKYIKAGELTLVSNCYPEAPFHAGNAMGRNKYIYCLSDYALVVRADEGKGGTWSGAKEDLKNQWVPLFVQDAPGLDGNRALIRFGATSLASPKAALQSKEWLRGLLSKPVPMKPQSEESAGGTPIQKGLFDEG